MMSRNFGYCPPPQLLCKKWRKEKYWNYFSSLLPLLFVLPLCNACIMWCNVRNGQNIAANFSLLPGSRPWGVCWLRLGLEPFTLPQLLPLLLLLLMQCRARVQMFNTTLAAQRAHFAPICLSGPICPFFALHLCSTKHCKALQCTANMHWTDALY